MSIVCLSDVYLEMSALIDVHKDVACLVTTVPCHVVLYGLLSEGFVIGIVEGYRRTCLLIVVHGEISTLCKSAFFPCAIVIHLMIGKMIGHNLLAALGSDALWFHLTERNVVCKLHEQLELCILRERDAVVLTLRYDALHSE